MSPFTLPVVKEAALITAVESVAIPLAMIPVRVPLLVTMSPNATKFPTLPPKVSTPVEPMVRLFARIPVLLRLLPKVILPPAAAVWMRISLVIATFLLKAILPVPTCKFNPPSLPTNTVPLPVPF